MAFDVTFIPDLWSAPEWLFRPSATLDFDQISDGAATARLLLTLHCVHDEEEDWDDCENSLTPTPPLPDLTF